MIKIKTTEMIIDNFYSMILKLFDGNFKKTKSQIEIFNISLSDIYSLLLSKLNDYDKNISLEKLVKANYDYIKKLVDFIDKHPESSKLSEQEKEYFLTIYERLPKEKFIKQLNITVCPYCNRNYIFNFTKNKNQEATAQLDHFFDKKNYPYLAVTLLNLVPSCSTCNQRKSSNKVKIFHPYTESFNENAKFKYEGIKTIEKNDITNFLDAKRVMISLEATDNIDKVNEHIKVFNLNQLYEEHKDIVSELLLKREIYPDSYIDELAHNYSGLFKNREDLLRLITCGYVEDKDLDKRPLSKLIKDISEELELI